MAGRWKRLLRFRLRTWLLVLAPLVSVVGWWTQNHLYQARQVQELRDLGAQVGLIPAQSGLWSYCPQAVVDWAGDEFFYSAVSVRYGGYGHPPERADQILEICGKLKTLREIRLGGLATKAGLAKLGHQPELRVLDIHIGSATDDEAVAEIARLTNLVELSIGPAPLTDRALVTVARMPNLARLSLAGKFTDEGLAALAQAQNLVSLRIVGGPFTAKGFLALKDLPRLDTLDLHHVRFEEGEFNAVLSWPMLQSLWVNGANCSSLLALRDLDKESMAN